MRVLYLTGYRYPASLDEPLICGDLRYSFNLSRALARAGATVDVLTRGSGADEPMQSLDGVRVHRYRPELGWVFPTSFDISLARARLFRRLARDASIVIANSPLTLELALSLRRPLVYVCSGLEDVKNYGASTGERLQELGIRGLRDPARRWSWRRAARVDTTAELEARALQRLGVAPERIITIGPGVELERYGPRPAHELATLRNELFGAGGAGSRIVLSVSRFTPAKGIIETMEAFAGFRTHRPDVRLLLVGVRHSHRSDYHARVLRRVEELGLGASVVIRENVPEWKLPCYYSLADVTSVFSVGYDPLPTVIIESMSCGTPVVSTDFETRRQMIAHGHDGLMVPERDGVAWAAAVERVLDDRGLAAALRSAALARIGADFDMNRVADSYLSLFERL
jgi:glycosyltransferase involved in cell wall biosynthesis